MLFEPTIETTFISVSGSPDDLPAGRLTDKHQEILKFWESQRGSEIAPRRAAITPWAIPQLVPFLMIWQIQDSDYVCRLAGTEVEWSFGTPLSGVPLSDIRCSEHQIVQKEFGAVRDRGLITFAERTIGWVGKPYLYYRHLLMPLINERSEIHMLLSLFTFHPLAERRDHAPV